MSPRSGFTLIELMIAVVIIGVLASVALPTYGRFINESKATEGVTAIGDLYHAAVAYWERPVSGQGLSASAAGHCVAMDGLAAQMAPPFPPVPYKRRADFSTLSIFHDLGFSRADPMYFVIAGGGTGGGFMPGALPTQCGSTDADFAYGFVALCDLNGDGMVGGYSLIVAAKDGQLYRRRAIGDVDDYFITGGFGACPFCAPGVN